MSDSDSDDDDLGAFSFLKQDYVVEEAPESSEDLETALSEVGQASSHICQKVDELLLLRDLNKMETLYLGLNESNIALEREVCVMGNLLLKGKHLVLLQEHSPVDLQTSELISLCTMEGDCVAQVRNRLFQYISGGADSVERECRTLQCLLIAVTYLELYCQENYTGPELNQDDIYLLYADKARCIKKSSNEVLKNNKGRQLL